MKIINLKKQYCNSMFGGMLAILPMFFFITMSSTALNGQISQPYPDDVYGATVEIIKAEIISLREELQNTDDPDVNLLLMDYYMEVLGAFEDGAIFSEAFINKLSVFFTSPYSDTQSSLHSTIFIGGSGSNDVEHFNQPVELSEYFNGELNSNYVQLASVVHNSNGAPQAFAALFGFMNSHK